MLPQGGWGDDDDDDTDDVANGDANDDDDGGDEDANEDGNDDDDGDGDDANTNLFLDNAHVHGEDKLNRATNLSPSKRGFQGRKRAPRALDPKVLFRYL